MEELPGIPLDCYFLRVPKEIRLEIYRYLLLPMEGQPNLFRRRSDKESQCESSAEYMHTNILLANRQIHDEATAIWYSEAYIRVHVEDLYRHSLSSSSTSASTPTLLSKISGKHPDPWRYNPLIPNSYSVSRHGRVRYHTPVTGGSMYPHIFAQFKKFRFVVWIYEDDWETEDFPVDEETGRLKQPSREDLVRELEGLRGVMGDFVRLMGNHRGVVERLMLDLLVELGYKADSVVHRRWVELDGELTGESSGPSDNEPDVKSGGSEPSDSSSDSDSGQDGLSEASDEFDEKYEEYLEMEEQMNKLNHSAEQHAIEIFLDSGVCEPLKRLENVRVIEVAIDREPRKWLGEVYMEKVMELKRTIEGGFKMRVEEVD